MGVHSMTGFGRAEFSSELGIVTVEIKSVNNRFKDFRFRLPSILSSLEIPLRKKIEEQMKRGSFEINITHKRVLSNDSLDGELNVAKIKTFLAQTKDLILEAGGSLAVNPVDFLKDYFRDSDIENERASLERLALKTYDIALEELVRSRIVEGGKLVAVIKTHLQDYTRYVKLVKNSSGEFESVVKNRLEKKFEQHLLGMEIDKSRFLQEVVYYLERMDISEELDRIDSHLQTLDKLLHDGGEIGRKIDFIMQELNRETNTIGSKSDVGVISDAVVDLKVNLEKMREQALNLE